MISEKIKCYILSAVLFFFSFLFNSYSQKTDIVPIGAHLYGVEAKGDTIVTYGSAGTLLISYDNGTNWIQRQLNCRSEIAQIFIIDKNMYAFTKYGEIFESNDWGINWTTKKLLYDIVHCVAINDNGYFIRTMNKLLTLNLQFEIQNTFSLHSDYSRNIVDTMPRYNPTIVKFKDKLIVEIDSSSYLIFDKNLNMIDTISLKKFGFCTICNEGHNIFADTDYFYCQSEAAMYRSKDLIKFEKITTNQKNHYIYKLITDKLYCFNRYYVDQINYPDSSVRICQLIKKDPTMGSYLRSFIINNEKLIVVGFSKYITCNYLKDSILNIISAVSDYSLYQLPIQINDSTFQFPQNRNMINPLILSSANNGATLSANYDANKPLDSKYDVNNMQQFYYDEDLKQIIIKGFYSNLQNYILRSKDFGTTFSSNTIKSFWTIETYGFPNTVYYQAKPRYNFIKVNGNYIFPGNNNGFDYLKNKSTCEAYIYTVDTNFKILTDIYLKDTFVNRVFSKEEKNFVIHCMNSLDTSFSFSYTINRGQQWNIIKTYTYKELYTDFSEIVFNNKIYEAVVLFNDSTQSYSLDILDLDNYQIKRVCENLPKVHNGLYVNGGISTFYDSNFVYISYADTVFYTRNIFDRSKWKYFLLPNGGYLSALSKKYKDKVFCTFTDSIAYQNTSWLYISGLDTTTFVEDNKPEITPYLWHSPPYPQPSSSLSQSRIYWDTGVDIDSDDISVYDVFGVKIQGREHITIEKRAAYSGILNWECADVPIGVYLIQLNHGTISMTLKVMVSQ